MRHHHEIHLTPALMRVTVLFIGGQTNPRAIQIHFDPQLIPPNEAQSFQDLISRINQINIDATNIDKSALKQLNQYTREFMAYSFFTTAMGVNLRRALIQFLQNEIDRLPYHPLVPGQLGYPASQNEQGCNHQVIVTFQKTLQLSSLPPLPEPLVLGMRYIPHPPTTSMTTFQSLPMFPLTLEAFKESIRPETSCKKAWNLRLSHYSDLISQNYLQTYFQNLATQVQSLASRSPLEAQQLANDMLVFAGQLDNSHFAVNLFTDAAKFSISPPQTVHRHNASSNNATSSQVVEQTAPMHVTTHRKKTPTPDLEAEHKPSYEIKCVLLLRLLHECYQANITHEIFNQRFQQFSAELQQMIKKDYPLKKYDILSLCEDNLKHSHHHPYKHHRFIKQYLSRVRQPIPDDLLTSLHTLQQMYGADDSTARQRLKRDFLVALEQTIITHPENSYRMCVQRIRNSQPKYQQLFRSQSSWHNFSFFKHRFIDWIEDLERTGPHLLTNVSGV